MNSTAIKFALVALLVSALGTDAHALSKKNKAVIKSGILGTGSGLLAAGAAYLTWDRIKSTGPIDDISVNRRGRAIGTIATEVSNNNVCIALLTGYAALKAARNAYGHFKHMAHEINEQEISRLCVE